MVANCQYDATGLIGRARTRAFRANPCRPGTRQSTDGSALYYYGLRFLTTSQGRWLSRDPIGERGGKGLYVFVKNCLPNRFDPYGLADSEWAIVNQSINDGWDLAKEVRSREWQRRVEDPDTVETFHKEIRKWWWAESCQCCRVQRYDATVEDIRKWHHTEHKQEEQKYEE